MERQWEQVPSLGKAFVYILYGFCVSPSTYSYCQTSHLAWRGTSTAFWGGFLHFLWIKRLDHGAYNQGSQGIRDSSQESIKPSCSTTSTTPCITYKNNFCYFQKLLYLPFMNDVHQGLNQRDGNYGENVPSSFSSPLLPALQRNTMSMFSMSGHYFFFVCVCLKWFKKNEAKNYFL